jgi:hypothetical protein
MGIVAQKQELFENIARLRRVGRELPSNSDLASVRLALEEQLGQTVSRRLAARLLGVSHTALERWVKSGDLPVVRSLAGREEIPVPALLDLHEAVRADRAATPGRYTLAPAMTRRRDAARRLRLEAGDGSPRRGGHDRARARSLAYHQAVASKLSKTMVAEAGHVLFRWREQGRIDPRYADRWQELLAMPLPAIRRAITAPDPEGDDLRQSSPFAGALSEPERQRILAEVS